MLIWLLGIYAIIVVGAMLWALINGMCFMDADTFAEPELITRTVSFAEAHQIDMLTLQPWFEMRGLWERIVLPAGIVPYLILFPMHRVNDQKDKLALANGQFILIRRDV